jgi:DNA-binding NarL/FixJ family response regulator
MTAATLTDRQKLLLDILIQGEPNKRIADQLQISESSVKAHLRRLFARTGTDCRVALAVWYTRHLE